MTQYTNLVIKYRRTKLSIDFEHNLGEMDAKQKGK